MNIFYLHNNPRQCAEMHVDKHCVKMILEYAQLLSTAHRMLDGEEYIDSTSGRKIRRWRLDNPKLESMLFKASHINHPSAIWVRKTKHNYMWLAELLEELCGEYTYRYGKVHSVERSGLMQLLKNNFPDNLPDGTFTEPTPAMPDHHKIAGDSIQSYKNYYLGDKQRMFSWKNRPQPTWIL
jgi:hypothetical protein